MKQRSHDHGPLFRCQRKGLIYVSRACEQSIHVNSIASVRTSAISLVSLSMTLCSVSDSLDPTVEQWGLFQAGFVTGEMVVIALL
jgi:hypothetical protein